MLRTLKQTDLDAVIAASEAAQPPSAGAPRAGEPSPAECDRIYGLVQALPREAQDELLALMWTGGPKNASSFDDNLALAQRTGEDNHAEHLSEQAANLAGYLREGMKRMAAQ